MGGMEESPFLENYDREPMKLQNCRFCPKHFYPEHINEQNKLTKDAIPILHLTPTDDLSYDISNPSVSLPSSFLIDSQAGNVQSHGVDPGPSGIQPFLIDSQADNVQSHGVDPGTSGIQPFLIDSQADNVQSHGVDPGPSSIQPSLFCHECVTQDSHTVLTTPVRTHSKVVRSRRHDIVRRVRLLPSEVTPRKEILRDNNKMLKSKIRLWKSKYYNIKRKSNLISCPKTLQFIKKYKSLNKFGKLLIDSQLCLTGVKPHGRRYTSDEKIFSLSLSKLSPKCYAHLRKFFILPSKSTLNSLLTNVPLRPGVNDFIFQHVADAALGKSEKDKQCVLLFDEMAINKNLHFNFHTGVIEGFEDLGSGQRSSNVADKALVFMLHGLFSRWKFPVTFYFARDGVKTFTLKNIVKEIIIAVFKTGFLCTSHCE
ncbi:uncharacterized protein LOC113234055 [Hyposmocoma kahamanoa]|uniref:uncharacterized protein LOC113234055 n=1 Tax=Hyposmocoma kahamanoa TaxID=1477025 RepID=UPI000E6D9D0C|nr:uncharacterized protein LOC113234055 [Hyposmocoma kahamanoa]